MSSIGGIIKQARIEKGLTLEQVGKAVGVGKSTVLKWESGAISNMKRDKIAALSNILELSPSVFINGDDNSETLNNASFPVLHYDNIFPIATKKLPMLGEISCGKPIFAREDRESYIEIGTDVRADFCLKAKGDSMINARILDGDIIFIRRQETVENGEIAAVVVEDSATLKRVYFYPDKQQVSLIAENPAYPPLIYTGIELNSVHIIGKAVAFQSDVR